MFKRIAHQYAVARTISALNSLDDKTLSDIGIKRSGIRAHVEAIYA